MKDSICVVGFWLLYEVDTNKASIIKPPVASNSAKYDINVLKDTDYFNYVKANIVSLYEDNVGIYILAEGEEDEFVIDLIKDKLKKSRIPYTRIITTTDQIMDKANALRMVLANNAGKIEAEFIKL